MKRHPRTFLPALALALILPAAASAAAADLKPCKVPGPEGEVEARCGTFEVWEDREARSGRKLQLPVVVLPATGPNPKPDPIFYIGGGPGEAVTAFAGWAAAADAELRKQRDLVLVDVRGTTGPGRLTCTLGTREDDLQSFLGDMFPLEAVRECRRELEKVADLRLYTTEILVDDLDDARAWLGYDKVNLDGGSYGTRVAQVWMRRHPDSVRAAVLSGVIPMDEKNPLSHAWAAQRSLDLVLDWCEADPACHKAFPKVREELKQVMDRFAKGPVEVEVRHPATGEPVKVRMPRNALADGLRVLLYGDEGTGVLPLLIHQAAKGDVAPLAEAAARSRFGIITALAFGETLSVTCAEDIPHIDPAEIPARTEGTFLGDMRVSQQMAACKEWPRGRVTPGHREPLRTDIPVLLISGERDPVTPPEFGERAKMHMKNGLHVVVPYGSHGGGGDCRGQLRRQLFEKGSVQGIDTSCLERIEPPKFLLELPEQPKQEPKKD